MVRSVILAERQVAEDRSTGDFIRWLIHGGFRGWLHRMLCAEREDVYYIGGSDTLPPPLTAEQEQ